MSIIYAFSGLGADKRVFSFLDLTGFQIVFVEWLRPLDHEDLKSYVIRLATYYQIPKSGAIVIGVSFGGMCIAELSKYYDFKKTILISSAKTKNELPKSYLFAKLFPLQKIIPNHLIAQPNQLLYWLFGVKNQKDKILLASIIKETDPIFLKWAINQIVKWKNITIPVNCLHLHGDKDRIIPIFNVDYSIKIKEGGHMMIINKSMEISFHIRNFLVSHI